MMNESFAKKFLKAYIACAVVTLNFVSIGSFLILFLEKSWWCLVALGFIPVTTGLLAVMISEKVNQNED